MCIIFLDIDNKLDKLFVDKISSVKIVSTIWLKNNQIIVCFEGNTIFLYEVLEGKYKKYFLFVNDFSYLMEMSFN